VDYPGLKDMVYTPLVPKAGNHFWTLSLDSISVGGTPVNAPAVSGAPTFPAFTPLPALDVTLCRTTPESQPRYLPSFTTVFI